MIFACEELFEEINHCFLAMQRMLMQVSSSPTTKVQWFYESSAIKKKIVCEMENTET